MRDYSKVRPTFWTRGTGKRLRKDRDARDVALYLMTAPGMHMTGIYHLAVPAMAHHLDLSDEACSKALRRLSEEGFAYYDEESELVFVVNGAREQIGKSLKPKDLQIKGIDKHLAQLDSHPFVNKFVELYGEAYHLETKPARTPIRSPFEAPSKPGTGTGTGTGRSSCRELQ